jgi:hypothetical protein
VGQGRRRGGDAVDGDAERARMQQGGGRLLGGAAEQAAAGADGDRGADLAPTRRGPGLVGDVEGDRPVRGERQAAVGGLVDLDVEADAAADQPAGDAHARAGRQPAAGLAVEVERHRRPAPAGIRVGEHVEDDLGVGVDVRVGRPCPHGRDDRVRRVACRRPICGSWWRAGMNLRHPSG